MRSHLHSTFALPHFCLLHSTSCILHSTFVLHQSSPALSPALERMTWRMPHLLGLSAGLQLCPRAGSLINYFIFILTILLITKYNICRVRADFQIPRSARDSCSLPKRPCTSRFFENLIRIAVRLLTAGRAPALRLYLQAGHSANPGKHSRRQRWGQRKANFDPQNVERLPGVTTGLLLHFTFYILHSTFASPGRCYSLLFWKIKTKNPS